MQARPSAAGWCPSIQAVLREDWWSGRLIYEGHAYVDGDGVERVRMMALCPFCGKWVPVRTGNLLLAHEQPTGSDGSRLRKAEAAERKYRELRAREVTRAMLRAQRKQLQAVA